MARIISTRRDARGVFAPAFSTRDESGSYDNGGTTTSPAAWLVNHIGFGGAGLNTTAGVPIDEWIAEGMPEVYACVHAISETVGQLPFKLFEKTTNGRELADLHPLYPVLSVLTNPEMTAFQVREMMTRHLAMWGRSYAFVQRDRQNEVQALWPIHPLRVKVDRDHLNRKRYTVAMADGTPQQFLFDPDRPPIFHLHINSNDGLDGRSPIWINRQSLGIKKAADDFVGAFFGNGAIPGFILTHPGKLTEKAKDNLKREWFKKFGGAQNRNKMAVFEEGLKLDILSHDNEKSQLSELREDQVSAASRIWRVPGFIIQNHTKETSWGSGVEQMMIGWINTGLMPYFEQWQQAVTRDLLSRKTWRTHYAKFITAAITRGDLKSTMDAIATGRQNTILSGDEAREMLEMNKIPDGVGETYLIPSGAQVLLGDGLPVGPEPAPVPADKKPVAPGSEAVN